MTSVTPRIAIVGGGPAGLCLGVLLHKYGIPFTIYDLRNKPMKDFLSEPSGPLDLHEETGLAAIRSSGLWDKFVPLTTECSRTLKVVDKHGRLTYTNNGEQQHRPEIPRNALTLLLLSSVPAENITWGHKLQNATRTPEGKILLNFGSNGTAEYDFVIGADGAWSKIRQLLTNIKPHYGGVQYTTLHILNATSRYADLSNLVGPGTCFVLGDKNGVFSQRGVEDSIRLYVSISTKSEENLEKATEKVTVASLKKLLLTDPDMFGMWGDETKGLISTACDEEAARMKVAQLPPFKPMYMLPIGHKWPAQPGLALIGDAAHLMMPWAGEGVNQALRDALDLANATATAYRSSQNPTEFRECLTPLVAEFDKEMFSRTQAAAEKTWANSNLIFSASAVQAMGGMIDSHLTKLD
ncbi:hypothetical protein FSARC_14708 [Fusarium sarcochroum]|uniref:FAD-binding domain-containing protein n=1 Tax=Fusarium sarcochroum TaxID=1208366 RepID=A0A8H4SRB5_9HYPO|nr:hypothetical protein FSARC_14708 [Fusarium sarcochroum]